MSRHLADLEQVLGKILNEHRRLLTQLDAQQAAMKTMNVSGMNDAATAQESTRLRLLALETQRKLLALALGRDLRITGEVTLAELARQMPARATELLRLREQLREVIEQIRQRTHIGARLAERRPGASEYRAAAGRGSCREDGRLHQEWLAAGVGANGRYRGDRLNDVADWRLNLGSTALAVSQAAIQTTGNNISNAGNADYSRETSQVTTGPDQQLAPGILIGTGVNLTAIKRNVDDALNARLNASVSDNSAATTTEQWVGQIETTFNALGTNSLSSQLSTFFNSWSNLANTPQDTSLRQIVLQNGDSLAKSFQSLRTQLNGIQGDIGKSLAAEVNNADSDATKIATLNQQIVTAEGGAAGGQANGLRDQRDALLKQLSGEFEIKTVQEPNGVVDVYAGSEPLVAGTKSFGVALGQQTVNGQVQSVAVFKSNGGNIPITSGAIGGLQSSQTEIQTVVGQLDGLAHNLIFELNSIHSSGQGTNGFSSVTSTNVVADPTAALTNPTAGLKFTPKNGSFVVHVRDKATGLVTSTLVQVKETGQPTDTSLNSLQANLSAINGVTASISAGKLTVGATNNAVDISFSQDSSQALAALGINSFYSGSDASDIAVNQVLAGQPSLLAAAQNGDSTDNQTAVAIAALAGKSLASLNGQSLDDNYQSLINGVAVKASTAKTNATATQTVQSTLETQKSSLSRREHR